MHGQFKIDKNVPITRSALRKYPFNEMQVGDSFAVPEPLLKAVQAASFQYGKNHQMKFSVRKTEAGYRCWRKD